jgi:two-component system, NtrC family, sensor kinase
MGHVEDARRLLDTGIVDVLVIHARHEGLQSLLSAAEIPVVVCSEEPSVAEAVAIMKAGAADYVPPTSAEAACGLAVLRDVDDSSAAMAQLAATQAVLVERERLAIVGQLAAGVAHEINNPSAVVVANLEELKVTTRYLRKLIKRTMDLTVKHAPREDLMTIQELADDANYPECVGEMLTMMHESLAGMGRIRNIVQDLKGFSRTDDDDQVPSDIRRLLERSLGLVRNELRYHAHVEARIERVPPVLCSPGRISQVFIHVLNWLNHQQPETSAERFFEVTCEPDGEWVVVTFGDSGPMLGEETLSKVWDPLMAGDAPDGARTGLGLAVVRDIVRRHEGEIDITTRDGGGTSVIVRLPALGAVPQTSFVRVSSAPPSGEGPDPLADAAILVVDDEPSLISSLRRVLRHCRSFSAASSGRKALEQIEAGAWPDIILCDLMMHDLSGVELHDALARDYPELAERMLFITGGAFTEKTRRFALEQADRVVEKPISPEKLRERLRDLLHG